VMKYCWVYSGVLAIFWGAVLGAEEEEQKVLVDNKCQCATVTSKFVPSKDNPNEEVLERNIRIIVPLLSRENISDPTSPVRTRFVYNLSKLCQEPKSEEENLEHPVPGKSSLCNDPNEPCYTYDRNKCYTAPFLFSHGGKTKRVWSALTPDSCYID
uniref:Joining chain of multimeric IgA and IgM n=1 Tax=Salvator merianae TaxID=96440 RepID=A0A8D0BGS9_SALMN